MHSIISFCLCTLFLAVRCTEASDREAEKRIKFVAKSDLEIAEIKNNGSLRTIHDLGEKLTKTIINLCVALGSAIYNRNEQRKLSISISETGDKSSISIREKHHNDHKLSDIVNEVKERSFANILGSFRKKWEEIEKCFFGDGDIFTYHHSDKDRNSLQLFLSKDNLSSLVDVCKVIEIISWYLYVQWIDMPSDAANDERKSNLVTIAQIDMEWRKNWDDLLNEIHRLLNDTSGGYDGIVPLSVSTLSKCYDELLRFFSFSFLFCANVNNITVKTRTDSATDSKNYPKLFNILESMYTDNRYANASIQIKVRESSNNYSTAGSSSSEDMANSANPDDV